MGRHSGRQALKASRQVLPHLRDGQRGQIHQRPHHPMRSGPVL